VILQFRKSLQAVNKPHLQHLKSRSKTPTRRQVPTAAETLLLKRLPQIRLRKEQKELRSQKLKTAKMPLQQIGRST
jgi:hypothetical protein